jgi:hypothetical protein
MVKRKQSSLHRVYKQLSIRKKKWVLVVAYIIIVSSVFSAAVSFENWQDDQAAARIAAFMRSNTARLHRKTTVPVTPQLVNVEPDVMIPPVVDGLAPVISQLPTKRPVVFLGIDDGANKQPFELELMKKNHIKATLFLADRFIRDNPLFFKDFITQGSLIEDHTVNHKLLTSMSYENQRLEICNDADIQEQTFGRRPILFRPPGGAYNLNTRRAAAACGMKAVVEWIAKANGGSMQYQIGSTLRPGDIVLMRAFLEAEKAAGLQTALLENWIQ